MKFDPDSGDFEVALASAIAKNEVVALIVANGREREREYVIRWGAADAAGERQIVSEGQPFELETLAGDRYDFGEILGKRPALLVFWASWCGPCLKEAPHVARLYEQLHPKGVEFVSVSIDTHDDRAKLQKVVDELRLPYPVLLDPEGKVLATYARGASIPLTFVLDRSGKVVYQQGNYEPGDEEQLEAVIQPLARQDR